MTNNNALNISATDFETKVKDLGALITTAKRATAAVNSIQKNLEDNTKLRDDLMLKLQEALDDGDCDKMTKLNGELKRVRAKLDENPVEKVQAFDESVNALVSFFAVPTVRAVEAA